MSEKWCVKTWPDASESLFQAAYFPSPFIHSLPWASLHCQKSGFTCLPTPNTAACSKTSLSHVCTAGFISLLLYWKGEYGVSYIGVDQDYHVDRKRQTQQPLWKETRILVFLVLNNPQELHCTAMDIIFGGWRTENWSAGWSWILASLFHNWGTITKLDGIRSIMEAMEKGPKEKARIGGNIGKSRNHPAICQVLCLWRRREKSCGLGSREKGKQSR